MSEHSLDKYIVQALIHPPIRERVGSGEIIRQGQRHECNPPRMLEPRSVWRCDCGRRWTMTNDIEWKRRYWPWPR